MAARASVPLPRWALVVGIPAAATCLTAFFVFLGFPYDLLAVRLGNAAESALDVRLRIGALSPHVGFSGFGLAASEVLAGVEGGRTIAIERLVLRPAWSLAWFRGMPAIHLDVTSEIGAGDGTVIVGATGGFEGRLESVRLADLPVAMLQSLGVDGVLDADVDLHAVPAETGGGLVGTVDFELREGTLSAEGLPMALPFDRLHGALRFGEEAYVQVSGVQLEGPLIAGTIEGQVGRAPTSAERPLSLQVAYVVHDEGLKGMFRSVGTPAADGSNRLSVSGTLAKPVIR
jgi:type II secretion system protein N